jgi:hypothetical protein
MLSSTSARWRYDDRRSTACPSTERDGAPPTSCRSGNGSSDNEDVDRSSPNHLVGDVGSVHGQGEIRLWDRGHGSQSALPVLLDVPRDNAESIKLGIREC